jgi:hypothetical protein
VRSVRPFQPDYLGEWAAQLRPDFAGLGQGGRFIVLLSAQGATGDWFWALGHSISSVGEAHDVAIAEMVRQRFDQEIALILDSGLNRAE